MVTKLGYYTSVFDGIKSVLESHIVGVDAMMCLMGHKISDGHFRDVYEHATDPTKVIKVEFGHARKDVHDSVMQNSFCNVQEFLLWREIEGLKGKLSWVKDWFAPIHWISPGGHILCMEKTLEKEELRRPEKIPEFLWDVKQENFGWIGDKFVCHDYANVSALIEYKKGMQRVKDVWIK